MLEANTLARWGFNPEEAASLSLLPPEKRYQKLKVNLEAYELHTARDQVISIPNFYYLGPDRKIYINSKKTDELPIDKEERGGLYNIGLSNAVLDSVNNPNRLVFLYSPPGPASFSEKPNKYSLVNYDIGQLYLLYFDGEKTNCMSISVDKLGEKWLSESFGENYQLLNFITDPKERIAQFITTPFITNLSIKDFLEQKNNLKQHIFTAKNGEEHDLQNILRLIGESVAGRLRGRLNTELLAAKLAFGGGSISQEKLSWAYHEINRGVMKERGTDVLVLGGGCGGSVDRNDDLDPASRLTINLPNLSSASRLATQGSPLRKKDDKIDYKFDKTGNCQKCGHYFNPGLGPCFICEGCDKEMRAAENYTFSAN